MMTVAASIGVHRRKDSRQCVSLGPLLDLIALKLDEITKAVPLKVDSGRKWRLTDDQVRLIRSSDDKQLGIAAELRVDPSRISRIRAGKAYEWVED